MSGPGRFLYRVFYWTYERGSWQWDLSCLVFLIIIFSTPHDFLMYHSKNPMTPDQIRELVAAFLRSLF